MADEEKAGAPAEGEKKSKKKLFIFAGIGVVVVAAIVAALFLTGILGGNKKEGEGDEHAKAEEAKLKEAPRPALELKEFVVNLADSDTPRYLKTVLVLELTSDPVKVACEKSMAPIRSTIVELLSSKTYAEVKDIKGKTRLRHEIIVRLNEILGMSGVTQVYFTDFIIQ